MSGNFLIFFFLLDCSQRPQSSSRYQVSVRSFPHERIAHEHVQFHTADASSGSVWAIVFILDH